MNQSFSSYTPSGRDEKTDGLWQIIRRELNREHISIGKTRVSPGHGWLVIGIAVGIVIGALLVANRDGNFEQSLAAIGTSITGTQSSSSPVATLALLPLPTQTLANGTRILYRFSISANPDIGLALQSLDFTFTERNISPVTNINFQAYSDSSFGQAVPVRTVVTRKLLVSASNVEKQFAVTVKGRSNQEIERMPPGTIRYFELKGTIRKNRGDASLSTKLDQVQVISKIGGLPERTLSDGGAAASTTPSITVTSPNGGEVWQRGQTYQVQWQSSLNVGYAADISLQKEGTNVLSFIDGRLPNSGNYSWVIPVAIDSGQYRLCIGLSTRGETRDCSNSPFSIAAGTSATTTPSSTTTPTQ